SPTPDALRSPVSSVIKVSGKSRDGALPALNSTSTTSTGTSGGNLDLIVDEPEPAAASSTANPGEQSTPPAPPVPRAEVVPARRPPEIRPVKQDRPLQEKEKTPITK